MSSDLKFYASSYIPLVPNLPTKYRIVASVNGKDVASADLEVSLQPANFRFTFEPNEIKVRAGEIVTLMLNVTAEKGVKPFSFTLDGAAGIPGYDPCSAELINTSKVYQVNDVPMSIPVQVRLLKFEAGTKTCELYSYARLQGEEYYWYNQYAIRPGLAQGPKLTWIPIP